jgi:transposase
MSNSTRWVGIDLHRRRSQIAIVDEHGELTLSRRIVNDPGTFGELLGDPDGTHVALEATYGWEWLAELLEEAGYDVHLAHPLRTQAIAAARVKTDAVDAKTLAHLLRTGLLPEAYIAPPELRDLRELLRHRAVLTRMRTAVKNRVHALLARQGILPEHTDLFGKAGREFLASLELPEGSRRRLDSLMSLIGDFDREITATTREIDARAKTDERVKTLCQIRGVGRYTAMLIIAEVGDVTRFPTARHLCAWAGLAPTVRSSDGKARLGHISHQGSPALRWALTEAAQKDLRRRRAAARHLRADGQAPRAQHRQGRRRPPDPHPLLLRAPRRRDPLPQTPAHRRPRQPAAGRGRMTHASSHQTRAHEGARCMLGRARSCVWPPSRHRSGRP